MADEPQSLAEDLQRVPQEARRLWEHLPDKLLFGLLLALWGGLFHFLGNSTIGYVKTTSLFGWTHYVLSTSEADSLGLYIPFLVAGFIYWKRQELIDVPKQRWWPGVTLVALGLLLHCMGYLVQQSRVSIVGFFLGLYGLMGMVWGWRWLTVIFFPFCLFIFCVPLATETERITFPMRLYASQITAFICRSILGMEDLILNGTQLLDAKGRYQYEIAAACSGIKSLSATLAISVIGGFVFFRSFWRRSVTFLAAFPLAVLGNVLRLSAIIVASGAFGRQAGQFVHDNAVLSLLPYIPAVGGVIVLIWLLEEREPGAVAPSRSADAGTPSTLADGDSPPAPTH
jgi:exosortase